MILPDGLLSWLFTYRADGNEVGNEVGKCVLFELLFDSCNMKSEVLIPILLDT